MYLKGGFISRRLHDRTNSYRKFFRNERSVFQRDPEIIQPTQGKPSSVLPLHINPFECRDVEAQGKEVETAAVRTKSWSISMCVDSLPGRAVVDISVVNEFSLSPAVSLKIEVFAFRSETLPIPNRGTETER